MRRNRFLVLAAGLASMLVIALAVSGIRGCSDQTVVVQTGEIVICTYGEVVSDTTDEVEVPSREVADHGVTTRVITCDFHSKLEALHAQALQALADDDLDAAERILAEIAEEDASYRDSSSLLADVRSGEQPEPDATPVGPIANLMDYLPDYLPGFVGQRLYADPFNLFRDYLPESRGDVVQLSGEVEQLQDAAMVTRRIDDRVKSYYPNDGEMLKVGELDAYFGTRPGAAVIAVGDRSVLVTFEFATASSNPASHKDALVNVAKASTKQ